MVRQDCYGLLVIEDIRVAGGAEAAVLHNHHTQAKRKINVRVVQKD
jgi:hypothetical protein